MGKRLKIGVLAAVFMLFLPIWFSPSPGENLVNSAPIATVALAGHVSSSGVYCDCNGQCGGGGNLTISPSVQDDDQNSNDPATFEFTTGAITLLLLAMMYLRMRA